VAAFFSCENWEYPPDVDRADRVVSGPVAGSGFTVRVTGLPHGSYAVLVFLDRDGDLRPGPGEEAAVTRNRNHPQGDAGCFEAHCFMNKTMETAISLEMGEPWTGGGSGDSWKLLHADLPGTAVLPCTLCW
jgi:uncharacterized protein (DUF2141 family)